MFVVVVTDPDQPLAPPRAIGPFETYDLGQAFSQTLVAKWEASADSVRTATVVRVEEDIPGVVVGEL
jgi:hypothetical protein